LGAGATYFPNPAGLTITHGAGSMESETTTQYKDLGVIVNAEDMLEALSIIKKKITDNPVKLLLVKQFKDLSGLLSGEDGGDSTEYYSAINLQANTTLTIQGKHLTIITSEAVTLGAGAEIVLLDGATVTWILGGSLNLGAGSKFKGETYVKGAVNGATSDVCGKLFATGYVSVRSIEAGACPKPIEDKAAEEDEQAAEEDGGTAEDAVVTACPLWEGSVGWDGWVSNTYSDWKNAGVINLASKTNAGGYAEVHIGTQVAKFTSIAAVTGETVTIELHDNSASGTVPSITHGETDDGATSRREVYYTDGPSNKPGHTNSWQTCVTDFETNFGA
jgi:hypothetical protein